MRVTIFAGRRVLGRVGSVLGTGLEARIFCVVVLVVAVVAGGKPSAVQQPPDGEQLPAEAPGVPPLPPGALRLVSFVWHEDRVAICAEGPGPAIERGARFIPRTHVWVHDGTTTRQVATAPGTCEATWSPDGSRVVVVAPDGLWVLSSDLHVTMHLVDTRPTEAPANEFNHRTLSGPKWAPDASRLAFLVSNGETSWVEVVNVKTGEVLYTSGPETYNFIWGADSRSLRFGSRVTRLP